MGLVPYFSPTMRAYMHLTLLVSVLRLAVGQEIILPGHTKLENYHSPLPHTYIVPNLLPKSFSWSNVGGVSYLTRSLNQHLPQVRRGDWCSAFIISLRYCSVWSSMVIFSHYDLPVSDIHTLYTFVLHFVARIVLWGVLGPCSCI
jgi:hypothetical protein